MNNSQGPQRVVTDLPVQTINLSFSNWDVFVTSTRSQQVIGQHFA